MEIDFHGMKRKKLQALCKKHGIPANLKNKEMADRLSFIFKGKEIEDPVGSDNAGRKKDTPRCDGGKDTNVEMIDLVTPSPGLEERSVISAKCLKGSEIERLEFETNLSPEITREDFGICGVEEGMKCGLNKEHVVNSQGGLHSAPVVVALDEFSNPLVEVEVEKLGGKNHLLEDVCEDGKGRDEAVEQGDHNSPQGSNIKDVNVLFVSQVESGYPMVEENETVEQGDHSSPQESKMKDLNVYHVYQEKSGYPMNEEDEAAEQGNHKCPQVSNVEDVNILHVSPEESSYPMVEEDEAVEQGDHNSPQGSKMKDVNILHVAQEESGYPMVEEDEVLEQGDHNSPQGSNLKDLNVLHVSQEESSYPMVEVQKSDDNVYNGSVYNLISSGSDVDAKDTDGKTNLNAEHFTDDVPSCLNKYSVGTPDQFQRTCPGNELNSSDLNIHQDTCEGELKAPQKTGPIADPGECIGFSPNNLEASAIKGFQAETYFDQSTLGDVEGNCDMKERTRSVEMGEVEHCIDKFHSSTFKESNGTPVQFLSNDALNEVKSDLNTHEMVVSGIVIRNADTSQAKFESSRKINLSPTLERMIGCYPKQLNNSEIKVFQSETIFFQEPPAVDIGICDVENIQIDVNKDQVDDNQHVIHVATRVMDLNKKDLIQVASVEVGDKLLEGEVKKSGLIADSVEGDIRICALDENMQISVNKEQVDDSQQAIHTTSSAIMVNGDLVQVASVEVGDHLLEGEVAKSGLIVDSREVDIGICDMENLQNGVNEKQVDIGICDVEVNVQNDISEEQVDDSQQVIHAASSEDLVQVASVEVGDHLLEGELEKSGLITYSEEVDIGIWDVEENVQNDVNEEQVDIGICDVEENMLNDVNEEQVDGSQQVIHASSSVMDLNKEDLVHVATVEVGDHWLEGKVEKTGLIADSEEVDIGICDVENMQIDVNKKQVDGSQRVIHASSSVMVLNNEDRLQVASVEVGDHLLEGEVEKSGMIVDLEEVDIGICDVEENMQIDVNKEQVDDNQQVIHAASCIMVLNNEGVVQVASVEVGDSLLEEEVEQSGLIVDSEECIGFLQNNFDPSATKGFQAKANFDPSTLGDVANCNMAESLQSDQIEKEYSPEVLHMANELERSMESEMMEGEFIRLFDNSDVHDDADGTGVEDKSEHYIKRDMDIIEKYLLNEFQSIDDTSGQNSDGKPNEYAPTVPQSIEMKSCVFNLQQISTSDTVSGDEGTFQEKLETPVKRPPIPGSEDSVIFYPNLESSMKKELKIVKSLTVKRARDVLGASDMKENTKIVKKEQVGSIISRSAFPKRKPLQDLQQN